MTIQTDYKKWTETMEFIDLKSQYRAYKQEFDNAVSKVISDTTFIGGEHVSMLEAELASYVGVKHCISCGNGTDALQLIYMAHEIGQGDAVFCPDMTFIASVEPAAMLGATPVFVDIDPVSYNINPYALEKRIEETRREGKVVPRAVVAVDFLGNPADYDKLADICDAYDLLLIEDAAQGIGGIYKGQMLGSLGDIAATSFFPSKPLGCYGDGGAVFTDNDQAANIIRSLKVHGKGATKYDNIRIGINSRLDNLQAGILRVKLSHLEDEMRARQTIAGIYDEMLGNSIITPHIGENCRSAYAQYILLADDESQRETIMERLKARHIPSLIYYPKCLHAMRAFENCDSRSFPISESYASRNFGLPFSPYLNKSDQESVVNTVLEAIQKP